jgi:hypothetical protein
MKEIRVFFLFCMMFLLAGCGGRSPDHVDIRTGAPVVHIYPMGGEYRDGSALVLPFQVPDDMNPEYGERVGMLFQEVFLSKQTFLTVKNSHKYYGTFEEAMEIGRKSGVDLLVAGRINYAMAGGQMGGNRVDVSLRVVNVHTGNTVWYMSQVMDQLMDHPDVSLPVRFMSVFSVPRIKTSAGPASMPNMLAHIAVDMSEVMAGRRMVERRIH